MRKMTRLQELLSDTTLDLGNGPEGSQLLEDFPEILQETKFEDSLYQRICEDVTGDSPKDHRSTVIVENRNIRFSLGVLEITLDLPGLLSLWLPMAYQTHLPKGAKYEKSAILDEAVTTVQEMLVYLKAFLEKTPHRAVMESWNLVLANKGSGARVQRTRKLMEKAFRTKFKAGRKPVPAEKSGKEAAIKLYAQLMEILIPGFDKTNRSVTKYKAVCDAVDAAGIPNSDSQIADQLWERRSPKQVAVYLTAQKLQKSESSINRYLAVQ